LIKKKCFTFVEVLGVMAVISILMTAAAVGANRIWQNNRIDICEAELREMTTGFKGYITDYSGLVIKPDSNYENTLDEMIDLLNTKYLPYKVMYTEISEDKKSAALKTTIKEDPWQGKYEINIYTYSADDSESIPGLVVISSNGPDGISGKEGYSDGDFGDDILAIIEPNG